VSGRLSLLALAALLLAACASEAPPGSAYLLDGAHQPDVLVESKTLAFPPDIGGNRALTNWRPFQRRHGAALELLPVNGEGRFEIVTLIPRPRQLVLDAVVAASGLGRRVGLRVAGHSELIDLPLAPRMELALPANLPLGRTSVDVYLGDFEDVSVRQAALRPALPAGEVSIDGHDVIQTGYSLVDVVRPVPAGTRLVGRFLPPDGARADQAFELRVEHEGKGEQLFEWEPRWWQWGGHGAKIDLELTAEPTDSRDRGPSFARFRLLARGEGPPGRWQGLRLVAPPAPAPPPMEASAPSPPRIVVLYVMDALRGDHIGYLGGPAELSPTIDRLAAEGAAFTNYFTIAPNTVPSMKSLFSGRVFLQGGTRRLPADAVTLAERFTTAGYETALLTGNGNVSASRGLSAGFGFTPRSLMVSGDPEPSEVAYNDNAERCHSAALAWLDAVQPEKAFLHIQTIHPHNPYNPPEPYVERYAAGSGSRIDGRTRTLLDIRQQRRTVNADDEERIQGLYSGGVAYNDAELAHFVGELTARYPREEILLIFTSDHGDELFDHGGVLHGYTLYEEQLHVPLVFWWPRHVAPHTVKTAVDTLDLHRTLATLVSPADSVTAGGDSLWPLVLQGAEGGAGKVVRFAAASSLEGGIYMARSARYKLLWAPRVGADWGMGQGLGRGRDAELVFDLANDPGEHHNLAGEDILEVAWLREGLRRWIDVGEKVLPGEDLDEIDEETRRSLRALGYIQ
jgi:arylsulfatase A-like enzyme